MRLTIGKLVDGSRSWLWCLRLTTRDLADWSVHGLDLTIGNLCNRRHRLHHGRHGCLWLAVANLADWYPSCHRGRGLWLPVGQLADGSTARLAHRCLRLTIRDLADGCTAGSGCRCLWLSVGNLGDCGGGSLSACVGLTLGSISSSSSVCCYSKLTSAMPLTDCRALLPNVCTTIPKVPL